MAELGQDGLRTLAPEEVSSELRFKLLDRARKRRLRDIAVLRCAREVERARDRQKVSDLIHFHRGSPLRAKSGLSPAHRVESNSGPCGTR